MFKIIDIPVNSRVTLDYSLGEAVFFLRAPDGSGRLLDLAGSFFATNAVGADLLEAACRSGEANAIATIAREYDVPTEQVRADFETYVSSLVARRLLRRADADPRHRAEFSKAFIRAAVRALLRRKVTPFTIRALLGLARLSLMSLGWHAGAHLWLQVSKEVKISSQFDTADELADAVRAAAATHWIRVECKERALCCWALLQAAGHKPTLVVGITLFPLGGHCWCTLDDRVIGDDEDRCARYAPLKRYE
jgi:hypothetical protein